MLQNSYINSKTLCPFCKPDAQANAFAETESNYALYNISPVFEGHSLVLPKNHFVSLHELTESEVAHFFAFARRVTKFLDYKFNATGFDWAIQEGEEAGQSIAHLHLHILPRKKFDFDENKEWYAELQKSKQVPVDNKFSRLLPNDKYAEITESLKKEWFLFEKK